MIHTPPYGYTFSVWTNDTYDNSLGKSITITVQDTVNPTFLEVPVDIVFEEGETGNNLTWIGFDHYLTEYALYINGSLSTSDTILYSSVEITISVDGFTPGVYNVTFLLVDGVGNLAADTAWVTVIALSITTTTTTTTTATNTSNTTIPIDTGDTTPLTIALVGGGSVVAVVVVLLIYSKKRGG